MAFVQKFLGARQRRAMGQIMSHVEREVYPKLSRGEQERLRAKVSAALAEYHDSVLDVVKSAADEGMLVNEDALRLIARVGSELAEARRAREAGDG